MEGFDRGQTKAWDRGQIEDVNNMSVQVVIRTFSEVKDLFVLSVWPKKSCKIDVQQTQTSMVSLQEICRIVTSATSAIGFLVCVGLASPTGKCPNGHSWALHCPAKKGSRPYFWCRALLLRRAVDGKKKKEKMRCMAKGRLTANSPLLNWLPQLSPEKIVELVYHFSQAHTITEVVHETSVSHTAVADAYRVFRRAICSYMDWYTAKMQLGGPNKVVLVDESFLTRRKRNKGGFRGRTTQGHLTVIFGAVEMTKNEDGTHKETGRAILRVIPNKETLTLARIIEKNILAGSTVFSDGASMYEWMDKHPECFRHCTVIHAKGQFSKRGSDGELISTNGIEGLFSRMKRWGRERRETEIDPLFHSPV